MMAAILNSAMMDSDPAILDSDTLLSSLRFIQKHSHSTLTLTQTNSIWLKLIHFHLSMMMAAILNSAILISAMHQSHSHLPRLVPTICTKKTSLIHSDFNDGSHLEFCHDGFRHCLDSDTLLSSLRFTQKHSHSTLTLTQTNSIWFKLIHFQPSSMMKCSRLEFCHLGFSHFAKKTSLLIHSDSTWWWQPSWILPCHLGFRHLVIFSQIHSKTLSLHSEHRLIQYD